MYFSKRNNKQEVTQDLTRKPSEKIDENSAYLSQSFSNSTDLIVRNFSAFDKSYCLVYIKTICDITMLEDFIIKPLLFNEHIHPLDLPVPDIKSLDCWKDITQNLSNGNFILFQEGDSAAYAANAANFAHRSVGTSPAEQSIRGSHEGFIENYESNVSLIRTYIRTNQFIVKDIIVGEELPIRMGITYLSDKADPLIIENVKERLRSLHVKGAISGGTLQNHLQDNKYSPFPQYLTTERPSRVAEHLSKGAVVVLVDGSSTAYILPTSFFDFYHAPDDIESPLYVFTFSRAIRLLALFLTIILPPFYIAVVSFNFEIIPDALVANVKGALQIIPFTPLIEALIMQIILELLKEAAIRLPQSVSPTIGVVGALVIGTTIVQANLISTTMLIVIALTAISSFVIPNHEMAYVIRIFSFPLMFLSYILGFMGLSLGITLILIHLCTLTSFGKPYLVPSLPTKLLSGIKSISKFSLPNKKGG
ncbi:spore germination protein [Pradoshia sp.]